MVLAERKVVAFTSKGVRKTRVRPGSIAYWCLRFWDRQDLFEVKFALLISVVLFGGML